MSTQHHIKLVMASAIALALLVGGSTGSTLEGLKLPVTQRE